MGVKELDELEQGFLIGIKSGGPIPPAQGPALLGGQQWNYSHLPGRNSHTQTHTHAFTHANTQDIKAIPLHLLNVTRAQEEPSSSHSPTRSEKTWRGRDERVATKGLRGVKHVLDAGASVAG